MTSGGEVLLVTCGSAAVGSGIALWVAGMRYRLRPVDYLAGFFICFVPSAVLAWGGVCLAVALLWFGGWVPGILGLRLSAQAFWLSGGAVAAFVLPYLLVQGLLKRFPDLYGVRDDFGDTELPPSLCPRRRRRKR